MLMIVSFKCHNNETWMVHSTSKMFPLRFSACDNDVTKSVFINLFLSCLPSNSEEEEILNAYFGTTH